jgi:D-alanyl-D-alanine carboxypeptidase
MSINRYRLAWLGTALALIVALVVPSPAVALQHQSATGSAVAAHAAGTRATLAASPAGLDLGAASGALPMAGSVGSAGSQSVAVPGALGAAVGGDGAFAAVAVAPPRVNARWVLLADERTGQVLFEREAREPRAMASTTKVMTALLSLEHLDQRRTVVIGKEPTAVGEESLELEAGERLTVHQLLLGLLVKSANDAAVALADAVDGSEAVFVRRMNRRAAELGLDATHYVTPYGLDRPGHQTSARDLARLWEVAMRRADFRALVSTRSAQLPGPQRVRKFITTNQLLGSYAWAVGGKTGFTSDAGRCLVASASRGGRRLVAVALGSTNAFTDVRALFEYGFTAFDWVRLARRGQPVTLAGSGGRTNTYEVTADVDALVRSDLLDKLALAPPARLVAPAGASPAATSTPSPAETTIERPGSTTATGAGQVGSAAGTLTVWIQAAGKRLAPLRLGPPGSVAASGLGAPGTVAATGPVVSGAGSATGPNGQGGSPSAGPEEATAASEPAKAIPPLSRVTAGLVPPGSAPAPIDPFLRRTSP